MAPIIHQVRRKFNVSISETADQDTWRKVSLTCAIASNERLHIEQSVQAILHYIQSHWPQEEIIHQELEII